MRMAIAEIHVLRKENATLRDQLSRICREGFGDQDTIGQEPADDYVLRQLAAMREELAQVKKHLRDANKGAETNAKVSQSMAGHLKDARNENAAMREQIEHLGKANSMLHLDLVDAHAETAKETRRADKAEVENAAMREAIRDSDSALRKCLNYMLRLPLSGSVAECEAMDDAHHALRKIKPFLKP